jgi:hypothetical protein
MLDYTARRCKMFSGAYLDVVKMEHEVRIRQAEKARLSASLRKAQGSPSAIRSLLAFFGRY